MYTLRKITGQDGIEFNFGLGSGYSLVMKDRNSDAFKTMFDAHAKGAFDWDEVYGFVIGHDDNKTHCLFIKQHNFIMTDSGKTFSNITLK
jgi:hypothetical protein